MYEYEANVTSVYDGDTVTVDIDLGLGVVMHKQVLRLFGIDAPEMKGVSHDKGVISKEALVNRILESPAGRVRIKTYKDKKGKYGRWLAELFIGEENLNQWMVNNGHARKYIP